MITNGETDKLDNKRFAIYQNDDHLEHDETNSAVSG